MKQSTYDGFKRVFDIVTASAALAITSPLQLLIAILIRTTLGSPVLFRQERPGKNSELFTLVKFRTMQRTDPSRGLVSDADRLTKLGSFLRSASLDEMPTLWNVLRGEMSLVGPRPLLPEYLERYDNRQARRHDVRPGITGLAQVSGRNSLGWQQRLDLDVQYVENRSPLLDFRILILTGRVVLKRTGISDGVTPTMTPFNSHTEYREAP